MDLAELPTPCALVDRSRLLRNLEQMRVRAATFGVRLRPHVKTHKCVEIARLQVARPGGPITVSTLAEAWAFAAAGFKDITYAVPIALCRIGEALRLVQQGVKLAVVADNSETVSELERQAHRAGVRLPVWLKVDCGYHRCGVEPDGEEALALAAQLAASARLELAGLLTHAGHAYACHNREELAAVAAAERDASLALAARLRAAGIAVPEISVGSTPTVIAVGDLSGVTEIRPGNYAFFAAFQATIGACSLEDCAFSVLATVIGSFPKAGRLVLDAGALALSQDPGPMHVDPHCGFGVLCDLECRPWAGLRLGSLSQEHGVVYGAPEIIAQLHVGERVRIFPNHSCLAAACFDRYRVVEGQTVVDEWRPVRGW